MRTLEAKLQLAAQHLPPLVEREIRVAARRWTTYWTRVLLILLTGLPALPYYTAGALGFTSRRGSDLLLLQAYLLFFWVTSNAVQMAADILSSEKREGTLGLLFLTDLSAFDIVLGKLAACSVRAWHGLLAVIPVLGLPLLFGGVTFGDCLRLALVLANALFLSLAVTMLISSLCRKEYRAGSAAVVALAVLMGVIPLVKAVGAIHPVLDAIDLANPIRPLQTFAGLAYTAAPKLFWSQLATGHAIGWILIGITSVILPRVWQDRPARGGGWRSLYEQWQLGSPTRRRQFRMKAIRQNPMLWYASRDQRTNWFPWITLAGIGATVVGIHWRILDGAPVHIVELILVGWGVQLIFKHWVSSAASRMFARDRNSGALEMVLSTSMTNRDVVAGPLLALRRRFLGPALALIALQIVLAIPALETLDNSSREQGMALLVLIANLVMFPMDLAAVAVVGLWKGVVSKNASQAQASTKSWVLLMPWIGTLGFAMLMAMVGGGPEAIFVMLFLFSAIACFVAGQSAWNNLQTNLRQTAFDRFAGGEPWLAGWRRLGRELAGAIRPGRPPGRPPKGP